MMMAAERASMWGEDEDDEPRYRYYQELQVTGACLELFSDGSGIVVPWVDCYYYLKAGGERHARHKMLSDTMHAWIVADALSFCCMKMEGVLVL
jgi:hypothetical protein